MTAPLHPRRRGPVRRATAGVAVTVAATAAALTSCGVAHPGITNGAVSGCFKSIPAAQAAVHDSKARLIGVHRLAADQISKRLSSRLSLPHEEATTDDDTTVCAVAFKGPFPAGQVAGAQSSASGQYAVVLVDERKGTVLESYVGDRLPRTLRGHTF